MGLQVIAMNLMPIVSRKNLRCHIQWTDMVNAKYAIMWPIVLWQAARLGFALLTYMLLGSAFNPPHIPSGGYGGDMAVS